MEFQLSYFKFWKMMLRKCCTQYASKFGKLSSGYRIGKGTFSFQSQREAMPKNAQTTTQLYSSHVSKVMLKILQARFQQNFVGFCQHESDICIRMSPPSWTSLLSSLSLYLYEMMDVYQTYCGYHFISFHTSFHIYKSNHYAVSLKLV